MRSIAQLMSLQGRTAAVTGGAGHLGRSIAEALAECGASVAIIDRPQADTLSVAKDIEQRFSVPARGFCVDLQDVERVSSLPEQVAHELDGLDILVNNAAFVGDSQLEGWITPFEEQSVVTWRAALEVNLTACFTLSQKSSPFLRRSGHGCIINVASIHGVCGPDFSLYDGTHMGNPAAYAASKGGLIQLTRWLATALAPNVRVNALSPGGVWRNQPESFHQRYKKRTPLGRMATEEDFKGTVAFLASDLSAYVTGQNIMVDGGYSCW